VTEPGELQPLESGLERSRGGFMSRLRGLLGGSRVPEEAWQEAEEALIAGDVGASLAMDVVEQARERSNRDPNLDAMTAVREELLARLTTMPAANWPGGRPGAPTILLIVGVNGTGKTTTIGKLAAREQAAGRRVIMAAADTFRAAAVEQLRTWATRAGAEVVAHAPGADPAAVVYDTLDAAVARRAETVIVDTAGRLHTKANLMDELAKIRRIVNRRLPDAEPATLFVLDATTGQNGLAQAVAFHEAVGLSGIVLTKLDSTARGGIVFAIVDRLHLPIVAVGVGERAADLVPFDPVAFVDALFEPAPVAP
jgi:fused signal recognition particle receptor